MNLDIQLCGKYVRKLFAGCNFFFAYSDTKVHTMGRLAANIRR